MKILYVILLFSSLITFGQGRATDDDLDSTATVVFLPTTPQEYDFAVTDYKSGKELLGYHIIGISSFTTPDSNYTFTFNSLVSHQDGDRLKAIIVEAVSNKWSNKYYLCIPYDNDVLYQKYLYQVFTWDSDMRLAYTRALSEAFISEMKIKTYQQD